MQRCREEKVMGASLEYGTRDSELFRDVLAELKRLRSSRGAIRPEGIVNYPALYGLASQTNAIDCWWWLNEMARSGPRRNQFVEAARLSIFADGADVLARFTNAGETLGRDQRTVRAWSDRGLPELAQTLVDASYLAGSRAMHFVDMYWIRDSRSPSGLALRIFWCGHKYLNGERIAVYVADPTLGPEVDDFARLGEFLTEIEPLWKPLNPAIGSFTFFAGMHLQLPTLASLYYGVVTFRFGKQSTQFVRISELPEVAGCTVRASVFRQGVSFWFDPKDANKVDEFDWGAPILISR